MDHEPVVRRSRPTYVSNTLALYEYLEVQITGNNPNKGVRSTIVGVHDSAERRERTHLGNTNAQNGLLFTIREANSNHKVENVKIEDLLHEFTSRPLTEAPDIPRDVLRGHAAPDTPSMLHGSFPALPDERPRTPPPLPGTSWPEVELESPPHSEEGRAWGVLDGVGESNGQWLAHVQFAGKHLDVVIVGVVRLMTKISPAMARLEGRAGWLLLEGAEYLTSPKLTVYGIGNNGNKHTVDRTCIWPWHTDDDGKPFTETAQRVMVVGPDVSMGDAFRGEYAQPLPSERHLLGDDIVAVKFLSGVKAYA
ncbi:hypothetical protein DFH08DRAFT_820872 [Mycena albidolilacea]|uniref:Uncharacterized protein n=1 Tax=Mycena albidolilacea TaxID=1033008 RepID=A0AAD6ZBB8_9AGAR|nr:hypothetical protein DFH08DRAFT_820872 [Mycena albidolilacea]